MSCALARAVPCYLGYSFQDRRSLVDLCTSTLPKWQYKIHRGVQTRSKAASVCGKVNLGDDVLYAPAMICNFAKYRGTESRIQERRDIKR